MKRYKHMVVLLWCAVSIFALCCVSACTHDVPECQSTASDSDTTYKLTLVNTCPHSDTSYTEGLFWYEGMLCESTGLTGQSYFYKDVDCSTGEAKTSMQFPEQSYGEGSSVLDGVLYVLTYKDAVAYRYDFETLDPIDEVLYPREGWGLTTDTEYLYASDGSNTIYVMDKDLRVVRKLSVTYHGTPVTNINELEYVDGYLWANIWKTDMVIIIDPFTGSVVQRISLYDVLPAYVGLYEQNADCVLNGIAYNPESKTLFVTGKCWPEMFELSIEH